MMISFMENGRTDKLGMEKAFIVPPQPGTSIHYICLNCGETFSEKKTVVPKLIRCPKCKSIKCISPVRY